MLTHLHHGHRVAPAHHRWARDAVVAAQLGAAALVVVTALEWRNDSRDNGRPSGAAQPASGSAALTEAPAAAVSAAAPVASALTDGSAAAASASVGVSAGNAMAPGPRAIDVAVLHGDAGTAASAVRAPLQPMSGPVEVRVIDTNFVTVSTLMVAEGGVARIADLPAGQYRLILIQTTGVSEPQPGVAISASTTQITDPLPIAAGDVLLVSLQPGPGAG